MNQLIKNTDGNEVGLSKIEFIPVVAISSLPSPDETLAFDPVDIVFSSYDDDLNNLFNIEFTTGSASIREDCIDTDAGAIYRQIVKCKVPLDGLPSFMSSSLNAKTLLEMKKHTFVVLVRPLGNQSVMQLVCGSLENGMRFTYSRERSGAGTGSNSYELSFTVDSIKPILYGV